MNSDDWVTDDALNALLQAMFAQVKKDDFATYQRDSSAFKGLHKLYQKQRDMNYLADRFDAVRNSMDTVFSIRKHLAYLKATNHLNEKDINEANAEIKVLITQIEAQLDAL